MDPPLRFCMITTFYPPYNFGGDGISVHRLSNELAQRGHQVEVIHCIDAYRLLARREPTASYDDHPNVTVHGLRSRFGHLSPLVTHQTGAPALKSARVRQILDRGFDVIHYHNISLVGGPRILEYGRGVKLYTMHEFWLICPTHMMVRFNRAACTRPTCFLCTLAHKRPPQVWRYTGLLRAAVRHIDALIALSHFGMDQHRARGLDAPMVCLPNFVPATVNTAQEETCTGTALQEPYFLFVGRLERLKGLHTLIPVFRRYPRAQLRIAGTGKDEPRLRQLAAGSANVQFLGHVSGRQLHDLYRGAVALIVPSITYEMFPLVILEALREQTPVIVRNLGSLPEIVEESGGGFTYDTEMELIAAMDRLLAEPSFRDELGRRGHRSYQQKWTAEVYVERYLALIREIAASRQGVSA